MQPGQPKLIEHEYKRHGTRCLIGNWNVVEGQIISPTIRQTRPESDFVWQLEAEFGEIAADFPDGRRKVNVLILVWSYSNAPFAIALPTQRSEAISEGMN